MRALTRKLLKSRPLSLAVVSLLLALSPAYAPPAKTQDGCPWYKVYNYYSDASLTTHVGVRVYYCDGYIGRAGIQTYYSTVDYCDCEEASK